jgi:lipoprotein-anchoring transpeptidase ErfK/SrfK
LSSRKARYLCRALRAGAVAALAAAIFVPSAEAGPRSGVAALQAALRDRHLYPGAIDGVLGPKTVAAVRVFQRRKGLVVDGIPGPLTRSALGAYGRYRLGTRTLVLGDYGWDVAETQFLLRRRGYRPGRIDGRFGEATRRAARRFQASRKLAVDGVVGAETLASLDGTGSTQQGLTQREMKRASRLHRLVVVRSDAHRLYFYRDGEPVRVFAVATGGSRTPTPRGKFRVVYMARRPWWYPPASSWAKHLQPIPPGPGNPLGTRWMGISVTGVGIHGTPDARSVGYSISHGCVRMAIGDAEWLYRHVRVGTRVWVS